MDYIDIAKVEPIDEKFPPKRIESPIKEQPMPQEPVVKFGTGSLKLCLKALGKIGRAARDVFADGKVSISDVKVIPSVTAAAWDLVQNIPGAVKEITDLDSTEIRELGLIIIEEVFSYKAA